MGVILAECFKLDDIRGALARAYCSVDNEKKVIDPILLEAMVNELATIAPCAAEESGRCINTVKKCKTINS